MLKKIRKEIDQIDAKMQKLLEKRFSLSLEALKYKKKIFDKTREEEILNKISSNDIKEIFKKILKVSKKIQKKSL